MLPVHVLFNTGEGCLGKPTCETNLQSSVFWSCHFSALKFLFAVPSVAHPYRERKPIRTRSLLQVDKVVQNPTKSRNLTLNVAYGLNVCVVTF